MNDKTGGNRIVRAAALAVVAAAAALATACGSTTAPSVSGEPTFAQEVALAQCMRSHGVPNFPDPDPSGGFSLSMSTIDSTQVQIAYGACRHLLGHGSPSVAQLEQKAQQAQQQLQKQLPALVKFAQCMRSHGVPDFPDPSVSGQGSVGAVKSAGVPPNSPQFQAAVSACQHELPAGAHINVSTHAS